MEPKKRCFKCEETKPRSEFYRHPRMKDGLLGKCKSCTKSDVSRNYRKNIEYYKEYERGRAMLPHRVESRHEYAETPRGRAVSRGAKARWRARNRIKLGAIQILNNAVRDGRVLKPERCECCGSRPKRLHGHHDDYAFALDVRWLCPGCHAKWHRENGPGMNGGA